MGNQSARLKLGAMVLGLSLILSGCGDKDAKDQVTDTATDAANSAAENAVNNITKAKACDIFALEDAVAATGKADMEKTASSTDLNCLYMSSSDLTIVSALVQTYDATVARQNFEAAKSSAYDDNGENVSSLNADGAYWASEMKQLSLVKGTYWVIISASEKDSTAAKQMSIAIAEKILPKLTR